MNKNILLSLIFLISFLSCNEHNKNEPLVELERVFAINGLQNEPYLFEPINAVVNSEGTIYILDSGSDRVQVFDKKGLYLRTIGGRGESPGRFSSISPSNNDICMDKHENIYVLDRDHIEVFRKSGKLIRSVKIPDALFTFDVAVYDTSSIYVNVTYYTKKTNSLIEKINTGGEKLSQYNFLKEKKKLKPSMKMFRRSCVLDVDDSGNVFCSRIMEYKVSKFNSKGEKVYSIKGNTPYRNKIKGNTFIPLIWDLAVDNKGKLYVLWAQGGKEKGNRVDVYRSMDGKFLGFFHTGVPTIERNMFIFVDKWGYFYTSTIDSFKLYKFKMKFRK